MHFFFVIFTKHQKSVFFYAFSSLLVRKPFSFQQPYAESDSNYDLGHYDSEKELESSLPYGIQNVLEGGSARMPRSKNRLARVRSKAALFSLFSTENKNTRCFYLDYISVIVSIQT